MRRKSSVSLCKTLSADARATVLLPGAGTASDLLVSGRANHLPEPVNSHIIPPITATGPHTGGQTFYDPL